MMEIGESYHPDKREEGVPGKSKFANSAKIKEQVKVLQKGIDQLVHNVVESTHPEPKGEPPKFDTVKEIELKNIMKTLVKSAKVRDAEEARRDQKHESTMRDAISRMFNLAQKSHHMDENKWQRLARLGNEAKKKQKISGSKMDETRSRVDRS